MTSPTFVASSSAFSTEKEERKGLIIPKDNNKQDSEGARLVNLSNLFSDFICERELLYGARSATIWFYRKGCCVRALRPAYALEAIKTAIVAMREAGLGCRGGEQLYQSLAGLLQLAG